jgi:hypothetical protein
MKNLAAFLYHMELSPQNKRLNTFLMGKNNIYDEFDKNYLKTQYLIN